MSPSSTPASTPPAAPSSTLRRPQSPSAPPPLHRRNHPARRLRPRRRILPDAQFTDTIISLAPGDILTLYTDGVTEQENQIPEQFSIDRLKQVVLLNEDDSAGRPRLPHHRSRLHLRRLHGTGRRPHRGSSQNPLTAIHTQQRHFDRSRSRSLRTA
ncbi:MAG: SpoIIE family protein phosphatase [Edaphobacter sp.]